MNKRFLLLAGLLLGVGGLALLLINWFNSHADYKAAPSERELARDAARLHPGAPTQPAILPEPALDPSRKVRLAVGWLGLPDEMQNRQVSDLLTAELSSARGLELVDRQSLGKVLRELELSLSGLVRAKDAVRVGKLLRADWFLLGSRAPGAHNPVIARIVDARSGVIRDIGVFPCDGPSLELAANLAQFVRQYRQPGAKAKPRVFLAIGTFQDLSVNSRQADFPLQLRAQLTQAYRGSGVTLLERECVNALLQEVHLDLAGLTDGAATTALPALQSAFWLVDGHYQSYETSGFEVELGLTVHRIFGHSTTVALRDKPGEALVRKVKASIDAALAAPVTTRAPTRTSEAVAQMEAGRQLLFSSGFRFPDLWLIRPSQGTGLDDPQGARARRNVEEAARAFQTVLLLEPTNRAAKVHLASALRCAPLYREDEARPYYREVLAEPVQDKWVGIAQQALLASLRWASPEEKLRWLQPASSQATNPSAAFFQEESSRVARDLAIQQGEPGQAQALAEARLMETITEFDAGRFYQESIGMDDFAGTFGNDRAAAARRLVELYPKMKAQAPGSASYLLASIVSFQTDTNAPVIAQFEDVLQDWTEHPAKMNKGFVTFANHLDVVYRWAQEHKFPSLGNEILEAKQRANGAKPGTNTTAALATALAAGPVRGDMEAMELAFSYKASHRWQEALQIFEGYTNQPIEMGGSGPWGEAFTIILPSTEAAECRKQLGLPVVLDPREFDLGKPVLCLHGTEGTYSSLGLTKFGALAATPEGLWLAYCGKLLQLDFALRTNRVIALPISSSTPITSLCLTPTEIWVGTGGEGLVGYDLTTQQCERLTMRDGLLLDFISALRATKDVLWLGYGWESSGGLGKLDLKTRHPVSFTPSLMGSPSEDTQPPRVAVTTLAPGSAGDVWFVAGYVAGRYRGRADRWEFSPVLQHASVLARGADDLFVGMGSYGIIRSGQPTGLGVSTLSLKDEKWKTFPTVAGLPGNLVTALTVDGRYLWVGGKAYIALLDPAQDKVLKFAYLRTRGVDQILVGGGYLWAQTDWHLYRAALPSIP